MTEASHRQAYKGDRRALVIAIDFGTTYSGVSYAFLEPGLQPKVRSVTGFRGQEDQDSSTKVPTVLFYDTTGVLQAAGAETNEPELIDEAEVAGWTQLSWFKLLLRPRDANAELESAPCPSLPAGKTIEIVLGDFLKYMNGCAQDYISKTHANGAKLWEDTRNNTTYVLSHPNGWHGFQQGKMRQAAILGGLIPDTDEGKSRVRFVSEGEASFHWCVDSGLASESMKVGSNIIVADAGGGTIDVSAFKVTADAPLQLEETHASECRLAGSIFVTQAFEDYARDLLANSAYSDPETIERLRNEFDKKTKRLFRDDTRTTLVAFGGPREHDAAHQIRSGKLVLKRDEVVPFFERSCSAAVDAIRCQIPASGHTTVYLVGGFAASSYLFTEIQRQLKTSSVDIKRAESHTAKAVADGAVGFFLDRYISARVAKHTYGVTFSTEFNNSLPSHLTRRHTIYVNSVNDKVMLPDVFGAHVTKGTVVKETSVTKISLCRSLTTNSVAHQFELELFAYKGKLESVSWLDEDRDGFHNVCTVMASIPAGCLRMKISPSGGVYWTADFSAVVSFGTTEFKCHIEWSDMQGTVKCGPTSTVWNEG